MKKINELWQRLTIKNKTAVLACVVLLIVLTLVAFDLWVVKFLTVDLSQIMEENARGGEMTEKLSAEKDKFALYVHERTEENKKALETQINATRASIRGISPEDPKLGEERLAQLQALRSSYDIYCTRRDQFLAEGNPAGGEYVDQLYEIYEMQDYLLTYAKRFSTTTVAEGNLRYRSYLPFFYLAPALAIIICLLLLVTAAWSTRALNRGIISPIMHLTKAARRIAANDFYIADVETDRKDELGELVSVFNKMKYATGEYISALEEKREVLEKLHLQEIETLEVEKQLEIMNLELLRNQINPHFLFNTLNVIEGMANLEEAQTTEKMIEALSSIFRYNLKNQTTEVLLARELKVAEDYMYLQKMRFGDRVEYEVRCNVKAQEVLIPTFTLQPLLENAVVHGLSPKIEGGVVRTQFDEVDGRLCITIQDTGIGMSEEELNQLREHLKNRNYDQVGIGIGNIHRRIATMYDHAELTIQSREGEGTTLQLFVPLRRETDLVEKEDESGDLATEDGSGKLVESDEGGSLAAEDGSEERDGKGRDAK